MKVNKWYETEKGYGYYIQSKYIIKGKTHYDVVDGYGERLVGLNYKDIKNWKLLKEEK